jgi:hypothetical protein
MVRSDSELWSHPCILYQERGAKELLRVFQPNERTKLFIERGFLFTQNTGHGDTGRFGYLGYLGLEGLWINFWESVKLK